MSRQTTPIHVLQPRRCLRPAQRIEGPGIRAGFSLLEVLVSLGIFAVGLIAVSAVFPTAITIQRETVRELDGRRVAQNAKATILAIVRSDTTVLGDDNEPWGEVSYLDPATGSLKNYFSAALGASAANPNPVMPMIDLPSNPDPMLETPPAAAFLDAPASFHGLFNLDTRSYPKNFHATDSGNDVSALRRDYYWYPLIQATDLTTTPKWFMTLFVMHRSGTQAPPEVRRSLKVIPNGNRIEFNPWLFTDNTGTNVSNDNDNGGSGDGLPDYIQPGDKILADDGRVHTVILADATSITVNSPTVGNPGTIYFAVAIDGVTGNIKTETRSPLVWIEESISLSVHP